MQIQKESWITGAIGLVIGLLLGGNGPSVNVDLNKSQPMPEQSMQMDHAAMMHNMPMSHMDAMMNDMMKGLEGKAGAEFDQAFLSEMIIHHQGAVEMAEAVLESSERTELRDLANDIIEAQTKEINMMKMWQEDWQ